MWNKVLFASDGSPNALSAIDALTMRQWPQTVQFKIVSVADESLSGHLSATQANEAGAATAEALKQKIPYAMIGTVTETGKAAAAIIKIAKEWQPDYIVTGAYSRHGLNKLLLGSVTDAVVKNINCSLLVGRPASATPHKRCAIVCVAETGLSKAAVDGLCATGWSHDVQFVVANAFVTPMADYSPNPQLDWKLFKEAEQEAVDHATSVVDTAAETIEKCLPGHAIERKELEGLNAAEEIFALSKTVAADLLVLGPRIHKGMDQWVEGSLTNDSLAGAHCSVEILRG